MRLLATIEYQERDWGQEQLSAIKIVGNLFRDFQVRHVENPENQNGYVVYLTALNFVTALFKTELQLLKYTYFETFSVLLPVMI